MTADSKALWNNLTLKFDNKQEETGGSGFPLETYMAFGMCIIFFLTYKMCFKKGGTPMAVFRVEKTRNFTVMSNYHLRDKSLSLKAKGLLSLMLSLP